MELGVLVNRPLIDYKRASEKLCDHFRHKQFHKASLEAAATFTSVMKNPDLAVDHQLSSERSVQLKIIWNSYPLLKLWFFLVDGRDLHLEATVMILLPPRKIHVLTVETSLPYYTFGYRQVVRCSRNTWKQQPEMLCKLARPFKMKSLQSVAASFERSS